jgi:hypothetical protein
VAVEKLFSWNFTSKIRSQVIECSFAVGAEITALVPFSTATGDFTQNPQQGQDCECKWDLSLLCDPNDKR